VDGELPASQENDRSVFKSFMGGLNSTSSTDRADKSIYFIGLIDILTQYDLNKKGENFFKSIVYNKVRSIIGFAVLLVS